MQMEKDLCRCWAPFQVGGAGGGACVMCVVGVWGVYDSSVCTPSRNSCIMIKPDKQLLGVRLVQIHTVMHVRLPSRRILMCTLQQSIVFQRRDICSGLDASSMMRLSLPRRHIELLMQKSMMLHTEVCSGHLKAERPECGLLLAANPRLHLSRFLSN